MKPQQLQQLQQPPTPSPSVVSMQSIANPPSPQVIIAAAQVSQYHPFQFGSAQLITPAQEPRVRYLYVTVPLAVCSLSSLYTIKMLCNVMVANLLLNVTGCEALCCSFNPFYTDHSLYNCTHEIGSFWKNRIYFKNLYTLCVKFDFLGPHCGYRDVLYTK